MSTDKGWFGTCHICGHEGADVGPSQGQPYHELCAQCPDCGSDFVVWQHKRPPVVLRCMNCLHRWERPGLTVQPLRSV